MTSSFTNKSLQISRDFLQTAVIIDDHAFSKPQPIKPMVLKTPGRGDKSTVETHKLSSENERFLDTPILIKNFADHGIICSALDFSDYNKHAMTFNKTARLADIAIIDWELEAEKNGENALKLMSDLLADDFMCPERFRLVTIYTANPDLEGISQKIVDHIKENHGKDPQIYQHGLRLLYNSIVIAIYAKNLHGIPQHLQGNVVDESGLPERLISCFADNISGILPNTALSAITAIRQSTHRLLAIFNKKLDCAFLTHRATLPKPDDAASHLENLIAEEIKSILSSYNCIGSNASFTEINNWFAVSYPTGHNFTCPDGTLDRETILNCIKIGTQKNTINNIRGGKNKLYQKFSSLLSGDDTLAALSDLGLSKLTVIKTRYQNRTPHLTCGVILQQLNDSSLWVCIQPKCDSVRLEDKSKKFPLLPILPGVGGNSTLPRLRESDIEKFCHIQVHPQYCKSIEFKSARVDQSQIFPKKRKTEWIFITTEKIQFKFVAELKDEIVQNILNEFAATTARVGINPSEWLRKSGAEK